ncbi:MAG: Fe-S cluster assembly scaffold protein NifU [Candidatus Omnitrophota bacterium]|nr:Fe-S cluster assembly scaffold protein NifU [Candidatus Omnitrophota bacterium]
MPELPYSEKVMDHFTHPRNVGEIINASGIGNVGNPICGDVLKLYIKVENNIIIEAKFKTYGCGAAIATSSMVTELIKNKAIEEALQISNRMVAEALGGLPPIKMHCSMLAEQALKAALADYYKKQGKEPPFNIKEKHNNL